MIGKTKQGLGNGTKKIKYLYHTHAARKKPKKQKIRIVAQQGTVEKVRYRTCSAGPLGSYDCLFPPVAIALFTVVVPAGIVPCSQ